MTFRIIPVLAISQGDVVKTHKFKSREYIGDPINIVKIFNEKKIDELIILDIDATRLQLGINKSLLTQISTECFFPLTYGGGVKSIDDAREIFNLGFEKISLNTSINQGGSLLSEISKKFGAQSVIASVDVKRDIFGRVGVFDHVRRKIISRNIVDYVRMIEKKGVGEILLNSVDRDGCRTGYDIDLMARITKIINVPLIVMGGLSTLVDLNVAMRSGAAAGAGSALFTYYGKTNGILINYPNEEDIERVLGDRFNEY